MRSQDAKSDLVNVLSSLEAHWHVLEAEVVEINRDIDYCEQCLRKYGEWFNSPLQYLRVRPAAAQGRVVCHRLHARGVRRLAIVVLRGACRALGPSCVVSRVLRS